MSPDDPDHFFRPPNDAAYVEHEPLLEVRASSDAEENTEGSPPTHQAE